MAKKVTQLLWDSPTMANSFEIGEQITGVFAREMIIQSGLPKQAASKDKLVVLDNACGTAIVTKHLQEGELLDASAITKLEVTCADLAEAMVSTAQKRITKSGWKNTRATRADAMDTKLPSSHFTHVFFNFGPFLLPEPDRGIQECVRMLQPGGILGITTWMGSPWLEDFRPPFDKHPDFPPCPSETVFAKTFSETADVWFKLEGVKHQLEIHGLVDVQAKTHENDTWFTFDQVNTCLPGTLGMIKDRLWTQEQKEKYSAAAEEAVMDHLREKNPDGLVKWRWKAIIGTGRKAT